MNTTNSLRKHALEIFYAGLHAVKPDVCMQDHVHLTKNVLKIGNGNYDLGKYRNIFVTGFGKASGSMARALEYMLMKRIKTGIVNVPYGYTAPCKIIRINEAGHPIPDNAGIQGTREIVQLLKETQEDDLVICLISGGGSALFELPCEEITLKELQNVTGLLLKSGARIDEINAIRKHISQVKGGRLVNISKSEIVSLILSDVAHDQVETIASGPTAPDSSTFSDCKRILIKYGLLQKIPVSIIDRIQKGVDGKAEETPKATDKRFDRVSNIIIGNNRMALNHCHKKAAALGYHTCTLSSLIKGEAREVAKVFGAIAREIHQSGNPAKTPACIIAGGETTVTVKGDGIGGRNQEFTLAAAREIDGLENTVILSAGTDGRDGNTDAAGAIADGSTITRAKYVNMDTETYLNNNDTHTFFKNLHDLINTGPTKTNVMDIMILLVASGTG